MPTTTTLDALRDACDEFDRKKHLSARERTHLALINLDAQVRNGGFSQWAANRYAKKDGRLLLALLDNRSDLSRKLRDALKRVIIFAILDDRNHWDATPDGDDQLSKWDQKLDKLDDWYYAVPENDLAALFADLLN